MCVFCILLFFPDLSCLERCLRSCSLQSSSTIEFEEVSSVAAVSSAAFTCAHFSSVATTYSESFTCPCFSLGSESLACCSFSPALASLVSTCVGDSSSSSDQSLPISDLFVCLVLLTSASSLLWPRRNLGGNNRCLWWSK